MKRSRKTPVRGPVTRSGIGARLSMAVLLAALLPLLGMSPVFAATSGCPRIISQSPYITHSLQWLELKQCIVGVSRYDAMDRPRTGGVLDPDVDAIAALKPDVMLTSDWTAEEKWQGAAPQGAQAIRLLGFGSMAEIEANLRRIGDAAGLADADARADAFAQRWREAAARVNGRGRALVVSACGNVPYSFGPGSYIHDLFSAAGFHMVETHERIRHLKAGEPYPTLDDLVAAFDPDWLFVLTHRDRQQCAALKPRQGVGVVGLDGEPFFHPAPTLLDGVEELIEQRGRWQGERSAPNDG